MRTTFLVFIATLAASHVHAQDSGGVPLYRNLGSLSRPITTSAATAQQYFDQGLRLTFGFGRAEAVRSFREASVHDPDCAMCYWGEAWALGPYINSKMDSASGVAAYQAIQRATALAVKVSEYERAMIEAMAARYVEVPHEEGRAALDSAYADAMREVVRRFPDRLDAGAILGEALMVLRPWDHWTRDGRPKPGTDEVLAVLESVLARDIRHPLACHLYIHTVEASREPERAEECADLLGSSIPGASHIRHMPSHVYMRIGRYGDGVTVNQEAWHVDQQAAHGGPPGIYPNHNLQMLFFAASMDGQSAVAIQAASDLGRQSRRSRFYNYLGLVRFGRWNELLDMSAAPERQFTKGMWQYGRGMAFLGTGQLDSARVYSETVSSTAQSTPESLRYLEHAQRDLLGIAAGLLAGEVAAAEGRYEDAIEILERTIPLEDSLQYDEPEPWNIPVRQVLGAVLLEAGRAADAEAVYRAELEDHPRNGWSLFGLEQSLRAEGREDEADDIAERHAAAWARSDISLRASRF